MYEVERKLRVAHDRVRPSLADLTYVGRVRQRDTYFDHPMRSFERTDEALRVRRQESLDGQAESVDALTYKGPRLDAAAKSRREVETHVGDATDVVAMLEALDFESVDVVEKTRERYRTDRCEVLLDRVDSLGEFVEIEASGTTEDVDAATHAVESVIDALDLNDAEPVSASYLALQLEE